MKRKGGKGLPLGVAVGPSRAVSPLSCPVDGQQFWTRGLSPCCSPRGPSVAMCSDPCPCQAQQEGGCPMAAVRVLVSRAQGGSHLSGVGPQVRALGEWLQGGCSGRTDGFGFEFSGSLVPQEMRTWKSGVLSTGGSSTRQGWSWGAGSSPTVYAQGSQDSPPPPLPRVGPPWCSVNLSAQTHP